MKKIILALAVVSFGFANAQDTKEVKASSDSKIKFGVKAGLNIANQTYSSEIDMYGESYPEPNTSSRVGFHIGGFAEIKISEKFALQPELLFSTQGSKDSDSGTYTGGTWSEENKYNLSYLNLPIMAKYYVIEKLSIEAGPQIGFLLSDKHEGKYEDYEGGDYWTGDYEYKDIYKTVDFGLNIGAGYEFTKNIFASVRYNMGLSDIAAKEGTETYNYYENGILIETGTEVRVKHYEIKNNVFQFSVGYKF